MNSEALEWSEKEIRKEKKTIEKYNKRMKKELQKSEARRRKNEINKVKADNKVVSERRQKFTTTKALTYFIILNCVIIEIYSMIVMFILGDLSPLITLIGAVIGESLTYTVYCCKSYKETKEEKSHQLEVEKFNQECIKNTTEEDDFEPIIGDDDHSGDIPEGIKIEEVLD